MGLVEPIIVFISSTSPIMDCYYCLKVRNLVYKTHWLIDELLSTVPAIHKSYSQPIYPHVTTAVNILDHLHRVWYEEEHCYPFSPSHFNKLIYQQPKLYFKSISDSSNIRPSFTIGEC